MNDNQITQFESRAAMKMPGFKYTDAQRQVYKTVGGTAMLDMDYTVFGETISGLDVIDKIALMKTDASNRPLVNVMMKMEIVK